MVEYFLLEKTWFGNLTTKYVCTKLAWYLLGQQRSWKVYQIRWSTIGAAVALDIFHLFHISCFKKCSRMLKPFQNPSHILWSACLAITSRKNNVIRTRKDIFPSVQNKCRLWGFWCSCFTELRRKHLRFSYAWHLGAYYTVPSTTATSNMPAITLYFVDNVNNRFPITGRSVTYLWELNANGNVSECYYQLFRHHEIFISMSPASFPNRNGTTERFSRER